MNLDPDRHEAETVQAGKSVARLYTGDPAMYRVIQEQSSLLMLLGISCEIVPSVSSVFAAAQS